MRMIYQNGSKYIIMYQNNKIWTLQDPKYTEGIY